MGRGRRSISPVGKPAVLAIESRWSVASESCAVFSDHRVLLLALLDGREAVCILGRAGARYWKWLPAGSHRVPFSAMALIVVGRNKVVAIDPESRTASGRDCDRVDGSSH